MRTVSFRPLTYTDDVRNTDGEKVHAIDRLPNPDVETNSAFKIVSQRAKELNTSLTYHQVDVRDVPTLNRTFEIIADTNGRLDGLIAAAGINYETPALEYPQEEVERMMSINFTGLFMTAQAAAKQMVRLNNRGSICFIASMSGTIANRGMLASYVPAFSSLTLSTLTSPVSTTPPKPP